MFKFRTLRLLTNIFKFISKKSKIQLFILFFFMVISAFCEVISLALVVPFITAISNPENLYKLSIFKQFFKYSDLNNENYVALVGYGFILVVFASAILRILTIRFNFRLSAKISNQLGCNAFNRTVYQDYEIHILRNTSQIIKNLTVDVTNLENSLTAYLNAFTYGIIVLSIIISLIIVNAKIAITTFLLIAFCYLFFIIFAKNILNKNSELISLTQQSQIKNIQETFGAIREVLIDQRQTLALKNFKANDFLIRNSTAQSNFLGSLPKFIIEAIGISIIIFSAINMKIDSDEGISIFGLLATFALGAQKLLPAMQQLYASLTTIRLYSFSIKNVLALLNQPLNKVINASKVKPYFLRTKIELKGVDYFYDKKSKVLNKVNIVIKKGDCIGIVGKTGSGKSTLIDIILGLLKPQIGKLLIDNKDLNDPVNSDLKVSWQKSCAHVPQIIFLEDNTIKNNIALGIPDKYIDEEKVFEASEKAMLNDFIASLPNGINTVVGERGIRLSGGQRQRIGIARALYKKSKILIFDEATSALDSITEKKVIKSILSYGSEITLIMIAHRTSTLQSCNKIFSVDDKKIVPLM